MPSLKCPQCAAAIPPPDSPLTAKVVCGGCHATVAVQDCFPKAAPAFGPATVPKALALWAAVWLGLLFVGHMGARSLEQQLVIVNTASAYLLAGFVLAWALIRLGGRL